MYLSFDENASVPKFKEQAKQPHIDKQGFVVYYTHGCPFTAKYVPLVQQTAKDKDIPFESVLIDSKEKRKTRLWRGRIMPYFTTDNIYQTKS